MERSEKDTQIGEIKDRFARMTAAVFLDYKGMTVEEVTKLRAEFRKDAAGEKLQIKAGLIEGAILDAKGVEDQLATMPGKDELRAKLLATFQAPLQQFVALLQAPAQNFVYVLSAKERAGA